MDFFTLFPYIGILILVIINAALVLRRKVTIDESNHTPEH